MISENDYILSFYEPLSSFGKKQNVELCKNTATGQLYVKKTLSVFDRSVFDFIRRTQPPNVPRIIELLEEDGELIVIEEYFSGRSLREIIEERRCLSVPETLRIIRALTKILLPFHSQPVPIVHRDIKPENILLSSDGIIKLVDFNAAKRETPEKNRDTELFGTVGYAAPEQYGFAASTPATDVYAIGVLMTELSTGAFDPKKVPEPLFAIAEKCTRLDPSDRYPDAIALSEALTALPVPISSEKGLEKALRAEQPGAPERRVSFITDGPRSFLPPGFRSKCWWKIVIACVGYTLVLLLTYAGGSAVDTPGKKLVEYLLVFIPAIAGIFVDFNYRGIWRVLPLLNSDRRTLRIIGLIVYPVVLFITTFIFLLIASMIFGIDFSS